MTRRLLTILWAVSLLLCLVMGALWVRSRGTMDSWVFYHVDRTWQQTWIDHHVHTFSEGPVWELDSVQGQVRFMHLRNNSQYSRATGPTHESLALPAEPGEDEMAVWKRDSLLGFGIERRPVAEWTYNEPPGAVSAPVVAYIVTAAYTPIWFWVALFAIFPLRCLALAVRRRRRVRLGYCPRCGYDFRASSHRCPECGLAKKRAS